MKCLMDLVLLEKENKRLLEEENIKNDKIYKKHFIYGLILTTITYFCLLLFIVDDFSNLDIELTIILSFPFFFFVSTIYFILINYFNYSKIINNDEKRKENNKKFNVYIEDLLADSNTMERIILSSKNAEELRIYEHHIIPLLKNFKNFENREEHKLLTETEKNALKIIKENKKKIFIS